MKTLNSFNFKGKTVLLRSDLNSDVVGGKVKEGERIKASVESIKELKRKGARVVIIAHQGGPGKSDFLSLKFHAKLLNKYIKIKFVNEVVGDRAINEISNLRNGDVLLLENVRFVDDEFHPEKNKKNILFRLVEIVDFYVNDAFSVCHREQASIVLFPKFLNSCAGRLLEKEVRSLNKLKIKNCLYVLGGAKPKDNIKLLNGRKVLAGGLFAQSCLLAGGFKFGAQDKYLKREKVVDKEILAKLKRRLKRVSLPRDFAVEIMGKRAELFREEFPSKYEIFDIGEKTIEEYVKEIKKAKSVYMKGPLGYCDKKIFSKGTFEILDAIANSKCFSVIGGGHLSDAIVKSKLNPKKFNHISLSGGALLRYIAGEDLPGLEALNWK